jgi:AbrB family looped-hinge helix DNA binding protein
MTIQRRLASQVAMCKARVAANNTFTIDSQDRQASEVEAGEKVRVRITRTDLGSEIKPRDSDTFETTVQKTFQVHIPKETRQKLDLETGDIVQYIVIPKSSFPGIQDGPVRDAIRGSSSDEQAAAGGEDKEVERETTTATFSDKKMQKTGQVTVPADVRDKMAVQSGDAVTATVMWKGEDATFNVDIDSRNRITIPKKKRNKLGLEAGDKPSVRLAVFA